MLYYPTIVSKAINSSLTGKIVVLFFNFISSLKFASLYYSSQIKFIYGLNLKFKFL